MHCTTKQYNTRQEMKCNAMVKVVSRWYMGDPLDNDKVTLKYRLACFLWITVYI